MNDNLISMFYDDSHIFAHVGIFAHDLFASTVQFIRTIDPNARSPRQQSDVLDLCPPAANVRRLPTSTAGPAMRNAPFRPTRRLVCLQKAEIIRSPWHRKAEADKTNCVGGSGCSRCPSIRNIFVSSALDCELYESRVPLPFADDHADSAPATASSKCDEADYAVPLCYDLAHGNDVVNHRNSSASIHRLARSCSRQNTLTRTPINIKHDRFESCSSAAAAATVEPFPRSSSKTHPSILKRVSSHCITSPLLPPFIQSYAQIVVKSDSLPPPRIRNNSFGVPLRRLLSTLLIASLIAFSCASTAAILNGTGATSDLDPGDSPAHTNPFLKHRRQATRVQEQREICHVWTRHTPHDLCARGRWARIRLMRSLSLFSRDCDTEEDNIQLGELFRLDWQSLKSEADLLEGSDHLRDGDNGRGCILGAANSAECNRCFNKIGSALEAVTRAYDSFARVLYRFDCGLAVDSASATRPFSPNGTCHDCKRWYRKWLLVQLVPVWRDPPCINWCFYAQLACPHLATIRVISTYRNDHPNKNRGPMVLLRARAFIHAIFHGKIRTISRRISKSIASWNRDRTIFFADSDHCASRAKYCAAQKRRIALLSDGSSSSTKLTSKQSIISKANSKVASNGFLFLCGFLFLYIPLDKFPLYF
ncbi:Two pore potassium channel protein sup-9 [Aphelenchoides besseyi]|nr:Two pore potassium channel protein sup-9 [Aphelenchoides besseyi]